MTEDYCERYDMPASMCAHCRGNNRTVVEQFQEETRKLREHLRATDPRWVPAQWPGVCWRCGTNFPPGALIRPPEPPDHGWIAECCS